MEHEEAVSVPAMDGETDRSTGNGVIEMAEEEPVMDEVVDGKLSPPVLGGETRGEASAEWGAEDITPANGVPQHATKRVITCYLAKIPKPIETTKIRNQISKKFEELNSLDSTLNEISQERKDVLARLEEPRVLLKTWREELRAKFSEENREKSFNKGDSDLCSSVEDLNSKIARLEDDLQHNTYSLKEEKAIVKRIQALRATRPKVISNSDARQKLEVLKEVQALPLDEQIKELKARVDTLVKDNAADEDRAGYLTTELTSLINKKKSLKTDIDDLRADLQAVNCDENTKFLNIRQEASKLAVDKDIEAFQSLCETQVEELMRSWNKDAKFRREYMKNNLVSTMKRLGTADGRSLAQDEPASISATVESPVEAEKPKEKVKEKDSDKSKKPEKEKEKRTSEDKVKSKVKESKELFKSSDAKVVTEALEEPEVHVDPIEAEAARLEMERQKRREEEILKAKAAEARKKRKEDKKKAQQEVKIEKERLKKQAEKEREKEKKERKKAQVSVESTSNDSDNSPETENDTKKVGNGTSHPEEVVAERPVVNRRATRATVSKIKPIRRKKRSLQHQFVDAFYQHWQMLLGGAVMMVILVYITMTYVM